MCNVQTSVKFNSLIELSAYLSDEQKCLEYTEYLRWGDQIHCPHCGMDKIYRFKSRAIFKCRSCNLQFSATVGTIFEKSRLPMRKWILAIYLNGANKKGVSSYQLAKEIQVSQKSAWFMLHRIRKALQPDNKEKLDGVIMSDETFVGGKNRNRHIHKKTKNIKERNYPDKTPVLGLLQKDGLVRCIVIPQTTNEHLHPAVIENVKEGSILVTDEWI